MTSKAIKLSPKQRVFVEYYLERYNATWAAEQAGYKHPNKQGPRLLVNVGIKAAIEERFKQIAMGADEVLARLAEHARGNLTDFAGLTVEQLKAHPQSHLIKELEVTTLKLDDEARETKVKLKIYESQAALVHIGKHLGLFVDRTDLTSGGKPIEFADAHERLAHLIARHLERGGTGSVDSEPDAGAGGSASL